MRPCRLVFIAAVPALCSVQPRSEAQVPILVSSDEATNSYSQWPAVNGTTVAYTKASPTDMPNTTASPSAATAPANIPAPSLDKSIFSLIVFGVAGLCLI
ncbi:hypothetical protein BJ170DRAFT_685991 [Xylariales sp. AK1849]|nr:hypothetical protein BJ170DRAFT_685991 [Xylariales sp. AK1849]